MAPTICSEKDYRARRNRLKESRQCVSSDTGQKLLSINSNFGRRVVHRRSISHRNAKSVKLSSSNVIENDRNINNSITTNESHENYLHSSSSNESTVSSSSISSSPSCQTLDGNTSDLIYCDRSNYLTPPIIIQQSVDISNQISFDKNLKNEYAKNYSNDDDKSFSNEDNEVKMILQQKIPQKKSYYSDAVKCTSNNKYQLFEQQRQQQHKRQNTKGLVEIAMKTITLIRRNQMLQRKLLQLQLETKNFIQSVMSNPENQTFSNKQNVAQHSINETNNTNLISSIDQE